MDYLTDIKPLEDQGKTDAEILAILHAVTLHKRKVKATDGDIGDDLYTFLLRNQLLIKIKDKWDGPIERYMQTPGVDQDLYLGWYQYLTLCEHEGQWLHCDTDPRVGKLITAMVALAGQITGKPEEMRSQIYALTGGPVFADVTLETIAQAREAYQADERAREFDTKWAELQNGGINQAVANRSLSELKAALLAAAEAIE